MFAPRRRHHSFDIWPGFVDALATVLMVIVFVLMTFVVSHLYLADALSNQDQTLTLMHQQIDTLVDKLKLERLSKEEAQKVLAEFEVRITALTQQLHVSHQDLAAEKIAKTQEIEKTSSLTQQIADLQEAIAHLNTALKSEEEKYKDQELEITNLNNRLEDALSKKLAELQALRQELEEMHGQNVALKGKVGDLSKAVDQGKGKLGQFQSDFLAKLAEIVGDRQDLRVVGDRFIFQSEVLFDRGSADLGVEGRKQLDKLAAALKDISTKIPSSLSWILRVDGHTDQLPISTSHFPSNWELSSARAISVVRYLISQGINAKNLVAAGFGEFQPLSEDSGNDALARNRRIEFKLDQR